VKGSGISRLLYGGLGLLALGLAILGAFLPLLPTTPFLLVAAFGFARSSDTLHRWLLSHKRFGPMIRDWQEHGAISRRTKQISVATMAATPLLSFAFGAPALVIAIQVPVLIGSAAFVLSRPSPDRGVTPAE